MMKSIFSSLVCGSALLLTTLPASAQGQWTGRGWVSVNGGYQSTANDFTNRQTIEIYAEEGTLDTAYPVKAAPLFDAGGGVRVWKGLGVGASVSGYNKKNASDVTGEIPHPFFFGQPRDIEGVSDPLAREELGVHIEARWVVPVSNKIVVSVFGGPSYFNVKQELITEVELDETYPFDAAALSGVVTQTQTQSKFGFNAGVDLAYFFSNRFGVGGMLRVSRAKLEFDVGGDVLTLNAGGTQVGGGVRIRF
jgi:outer membrane protein with beta-barrel domain